MISPPPCHAARHHSALGAIIQRANLILAVLLCGPAGDLFAEGTPANSNAYAPKVFPLILDVRKLPPHPRLILRDEYLPEVKAAITGVPALGTVYRELEATGERFLSQPILSPKPHGEANLSEIRRAKDLMITLAGLYRLDRDSRKFERAKQELLAASALPFWDSDNFLETADLALGVALAYDWLFNELQPVERKTIAKALIEKALKPGRVRFIRNFKWVGLSTTWNPVCNGALGTAAMAAAEDAPALSAEILDRAVDSIKIALAKYAPDGGDPEGPMYWDYGSFYALFLVDGLQGTFGQDFGLRAMPGFAKTPRYGMATIGPLGLRANTSDAEMESSPTSQLFWFAREFNQRAYYEYELARCAARPSLFHLFWGANPPPGPAVAISPNRSFRTIDVAVFRDNWTERTSSYLVFKGGSNAANHAHLDLGSFILEANGERWALDLGPDDYDLPGYNGRDPRRWTYFRIGTRSHNTVILDRANQSLAGEGKIIKFHGAARAAFAIMDLSSAYPDNASSIRRGIRKVGSNFLVQDELHLKKPSDVLWNFVTRAQASCTDRTVELSLGEAHLRLRLLEPRGAAFSIASARQAPPQQENTGVQMVQISLPHAEGQMRIVVAMDSANIQPPDEPIKPLADW